MKRYAPGFANNEDAIATVVEYMAKADEKYIEGIGTRRGFRGSYAKYAVLVYLKQAKRNSDILSLDYELHGKNSNSESCIKDLLIFPSLQPDKQAEYNELIEWINKTKILTNKQRAVLINIYQQGYNQTELAKKMGVSKQAISFLHQRALEKVRNYML